MRVTPQWAANCGRRACRLLGPSKQESRAEEKRQREALKRRKEIDKAASQDEKERLRDEQAQAAAVEREAVTAQKEAVEAEKREAADAKKQAAEDEKQVAAETKVRQAEVKAEQKAEAQRAKAEQKVEAQLAKAEAKQSRAEAKRKAKRQEDPIVPAGLTRFVVDEASEPWAATTRKDARRCRSRVRRVRSIVVMIVVLLAVTGVAAYAMSKSSPKAAAPGGATHASVLPAALAALVSANSADLAYAQQIGGPIPASVNGGGSVDLATQGSNLSVTYSMEGQRFPEQIVYDGGQAFYDLGAIVHFVTPSYNWVSTDLASAAPGSPGIGVGGVLADPSALVSFVQVSAPSAHEVGHVQLNGVPTTEYAIALDQAAVTRLLASPALPAYVHAANVHPDPRAGVRGRFWARGADRGQRDLPRIGPHGDGLDHGRPLPLRHPGVGGATASDPGGVRAAVPGQRGSAGPRSNPLTCSFPFDVPGVRPCARSVPPFPHRQAI